MEVKRGSFFFLFFGPVLRTLQFSSALINGRMKMIAFFQLQSKVDMLWVIKVERKSTLRENLKCLMKLKQRLIVTFIKKPVTLRLTRVTFA